MKLSREFYTVVFCGFLWCITAGASPKTAYFAAYGTVEEITLYIQGGSNTNSSEDLYTQFYSLDLTQSWDASNPPWSEVVTVDPIPAGLKTWGHSISLSRNQKTLTFWNINGSVSYAASFHLDTNSWEKLPPFSGPTQKHNNVQICQAVTDPRTDVVYIPGGTDRGLLVYSGSYSLREMDRTAKNSTFWSAYSFVWSDSSSGSVPPPIAGSCMVPAYSGTKMLFFGGSDAISQAPIDTLYILDVPTMTWSQGAKYQPRLGMVCSVSGDYLIVWGGKGISVSSGDAGRLIPTDEALIIYSIKTAQWTTQFVDKTSSDNSIKKAAINKKAVIIGGSVSAAVVIILIVGVVVFRKRHHHFQQQKQEVNVSSPLQVIPEQDIEEEPMEKMYFRDNQPRLAGAITSQQSIQKTQPVRITPPKSTHSNSPQYIYAHGPQQDHLDPPSWRTSLSPSQRVRSVSSSRSSSTLVATPTMSASPRYPSRQHQNRSPQQQQRQSITHDPPTRRSTRHPQGRNTPEPTPNSNHSIQYQLDALHAEANRLQAMLHP